MSQFGNSIPRLVGQPLAVVEQDNDFAAIQGIVAGALGVGLRAAQAAGARQVAQSEQEVMESRLQAEDAQREGVRARLTTDRLKREYDELADQEMLGYIGVLSRMDPAVQGAFLKANPAVDPKNADQLESIVGTTLGQARAAIGHKRLAEHVLNGGSAFDFSPTAFLEEELQTIGETIPDRSRAAFADALIRQLRGHQTSFIGQEINRQQAEARGSSESNLLAGFADFAQGNADIETLNRLVDEWATVHPEIGEGRQLQQRLADTIASGSTIRNLLASGADPDTFLRQISQLPGPTQRQLESHGVMAEIEGFKAERAVSFAKEQDTFIRRILDDASLGDSIVKARAVDRDIEAVADESVRFGLRSRQEAVIAKIERTNAEIPALRQAYLSGTPGDQSFTNDARNQLYRTERRTRDVGDVMTDFTIASLPLPSEATNELQAMFNLESWQPDRGLAILNELGNIDPEGAKRVAASLGQNAPIASTLHYMLQDEEPGSDRWNAIIAPFNDPLSITQLATSRKLSLDTFNADRSIVAASVGTGKDAVTSDAATRAYLNARTYYLAATNDAAATAALVDSHMQSRFTAITREQPGVRDRTYVLPADWFGLGTQANPNGPARISYRSSMRDAFNTLAMPEATMRPDLTQPQGGRAYIPVTSDNGQVQAFIEWNPQTMRATPLKQSDNAALYRRLTESLFGIDDPAALLPLGHLRNRPEFNIRSVEELDAKTGANAAQQIDEFVRSQWLSTFGFVPDPASAGFQQYLDDLDSAARSLGYIGMTGRRQP